MYIFTRVLANIGDDYTEGSSNKTDLVGDLSDNTHFKEKILFTVSVIYTGSIYVVCHSSLYLWYHSNATLSRDRASD